MKDIRPYLCIVLMLCLFSSGAYANVLDSNPASVGELSRHQVSIAGGLGVGTKEMAVGYGEPDYGYGAGALGAVRSISDELIETSLFYTIAKQIESRLVFGMRFRYFTQRLDGAGSTFEGMYLTSDCGVTVYPHPQLSLFAAGQNVFYYSLHDSPRDLVMNVQSGIGLHVADNLSISFGVNDLLNRLPHTQKWAVGVRMTGKNIRVDYSLAGLFGEIQSLKHQIGLTWNF